MEYDRALYRVYERVMEDLCSTPSPLAPSTLTASSSTHATAATAGVPPSAAAADSTADGGGDPPAVSAPEETRRRQQQRRRGAMQPLPFCLPVSSTFCRSLTGTTTTTTVIGRFVPLWAFGLYHRVRAAVDREYGYAPLPVLPTHRGTRTGTDGGGGGGGVGGASGNGVSPPPQRPADADADASASEPVVAASSASAGGAATMRYRYHRRAMEHHRGSASQRTNNGGGRRRMRMTGDELVSLMEGGGADAAPGPEEAARGGLFHRRVRPREGGGSHSEEESSSGGEERQHGHDDDDEGSSSGGDGDDSDSDSDRRSSSSDVAVEGDDDGVDDANNAPPLSPAAARAVGRRRRRRGRRGRSSRRRNPLAVSRPGFGGNINPNPFAHSNAASSDSGEEGEAAVVGCTQKCLYKLLQLSLLVGTFHMYVMWALHSTYVEPGIVGRGRGWWWMGLSEGGGGDGEREGFVKVRPSWAEVHAAYDEEWRADAAASAASGGAATTTAGAGVTGSEEEAEHPERSLLLGRSVGRWLSVDEEPPTEEATASVEPGRPQRKKKTRGTERPASAASAKVLHVPDLDYYLGGTCIERALSTGGRPIEFEYNRTAAANATNTTDPTAADASTDGNSTANTPSALPSNHITRWDVVGNGGGNWTALPLLRHDEILQIKILYGGSCLRGSCSRVHNVTTSNSTSDGTTNATDGKGGDVEDGDGEYVSSRDLESMEFWDKPHYRFSTDQALLFLDHDFLLKHGVNIINVTVTERCLSTGSDSSGASLFTRSGEIFSQVYGMDSAVINQLMYGIRDVDGGYRNGYVQNMETDERWSWRKEFLQESARSHTNVFVWVGHKIGTMFLSLLAFFLVTSVTALIVRVLTSSGVVLMFPIFACFRAMGLPGADDRILGLSYPWIGRARSAVIRRRIHPDGHLIYAHLAKIGLFYIMYEACQAAWSVVLYGKSIPEGLPIWLYGFCMIWEYFSMVFVRSALSAYFFPRITLLYFLAYHFYFYSVPYGYFDVALIPLFFFMIQAMFYTILALEVPAASRGAVSIECPREVYNRLSWPAWTAALPHEWTLFLPLNSRYIPLHDRVVSTEGGDRSTTQRGRPESNISEAEANDGEDQQGAITDQSSTRGGENREGASEPSSNGHHNIIGQRDLHMV